MSKNILGIPESRRQTNREETYGGSYVWITLSGLASNRLCLHSYSCLRHPTRVFLTTEQLQHELDVILRAHHGSQNPLRGREACHCSRSGYSSFGWFFSNSECPQEFKTAETNINHSMQSVGINM
jgi:hypothetical protein